MATAAFEGQVLGTVSCMAHLSDSAAQRVAEAVIVERLGDLLDVKLTAGGRVSVGGGAYVEVDARSDESGVFVEAYARQGRLKGAQLKKVGQDILKLALLRRLPQYVDARIIIAFASPGAHDSIRGWLARAAEEFGVELMTVDIPADVREQIIEAQQRQVMVNLTVDEALALEDE